MQTDSTYNGWKNYPTWCVNLWIENEEGTYTESQRMTLAAIEEAPGCRQVLSGVWTVEDAARFILADAIKEWVCDDMAPDLGASFPADLLSYALGEVDWDDIAEAWINR